MLPRFLFLAALAVSAQAAEPLTVHLSSDLDTRPGRVAMFVVDGDESTYLATRQPPRKDQYFTIGLDAPTKVGALSVATGKGDTKERLAAGVLEISEDGTTFTQVAEFKDGAAAAPAPEKPVKAVRVRVTADGTESLTLREVRLGEVKLAPVGRVDVTKELSADLGGGTLHFLGDATLLSGDVQTTLTAFLEKASGLYAEKLPEMLKRMEVPPERIPRRLVVAYKTETGRGIPAYALGDSLTLNTDFVRRNLEESVGMFIHEFSHVVQGYPGGNPGWLVEGLADLIRLELSAPNDVWVRRTRAIDPKKSDYKHAYGEAARFLEWIQNKYVPGLEGKLNTVMHDRKWKDELWMEWSGKDLATLWAEYQAG